MGQFVFPTPKSWKMFRLESRLVSSEHEEFFKAVKRKDDLKSLLKSGDTHGAIRIKMLAVCAGCTSDPRIDASLEYLLSDLAAGNDEKIKLIAR